MNISDAKTNLEEVRAWLDCFEPVSTDAEYIGNPGPTSTRKFKATVEPSQTATISKIERLQTHVMRLSLDIDKRDKTISRLRCLEEDLRLELEKKDKVVGRLKAETAEFKRLEEIMRKQILDLLAQKEEKDVLIGSLKDAAIQNTDELAALKKKNERLRVELEDAKIRHDADTEAMAMSRHSYAELNTEFQKLQAELEEAKKETPDWVRKLPPVDVVQVESKTGIFGGILGFDGETTIAIYAFPEFRRISFWKSSGDQIKRRHRLCGEGK